MRWLPRLARAQRVQASGGLGESSRLGRRSVKEASLGVEMGRRVVSRPDVVRIHTVAGKRFGKGADWWRVRLSLARRSLAAGLKPRP